MPDAPEAIQLRQSLSAGAVAVTGSPLSAAIALLTAAFELLSAESDPFHAVDVMRSTAGAIERAFMASREVQ